jgi:hypothetical protein
MFVIFNAQFYTKHAGIFMMYINTNFNISSYNDRLLITMKMKYKIQFRVIAMLQFYKTKLH